MAEPSAMARSQISSAALLATHDLLRQRRVGAGDAIGSSHDSQRWFHFVMQAPLG